MGGSFCTPPSWLKSNITEIWLSDSMCQTSDTLRCLMAWCTADMSAWFLTLGRAPCCSSTFMILMLWSHLLPSMCSAVLPLVSVPCGSAPHCNSHSTMSGDNECTALTSGGPCTDLSRFTSTESLLIMIHAMSSRPSSTAMLRAVDPSLSSLLAFR